MGTLPAEARWTWDPQPVKASCSGTRQPLLPEAAQGLVQTETSFLPGAGKFWFASQDRLGGLNPYLRLKRTPAVTY